MGLERALNTLVSGRPSDYGIAALDLRDGSTVAVNGDVSYPMVFEAEGNIWMIPEVGDGNSIALYRASQFPGGWRHEACLVPEPPKAG